MFIAAAFTRVKRGKKSRCPSADEWTSTMWSLYSGVLLHFEKEGNSNTCAAWINLREISLTQKDKCRMIPLT